MINGNVELIPDASKLEQLLGKKRVWNSCKKNEKLIVNEGSIEFMIRY